MVDPVAVARAGSYWRKPLIAGHHTHVASGDKGTADAFNVAVEAERILLATGWSRPAELASIAAVLGLRVTDFRDRLCGIVIEYLRDCVTHGTLPTLTEAVAALASRGVPHADGELYQILMDTPMPACESIADLGLAVQQGADERTDELCRMLTREAFRAWSHAFNCRDCIHCQRTRRPSKSGAWKPLDRTRRLPTYV